MSADPASPFTAPRAVPADGVGYAASYAASYGPPAGTAVPPRTGGFHGGTGFTPELRSVTGLGRAVCLLLGSHVLVGTAAAAVAAWSALTYATLSGLSTDVRLAPDVAASALLVVTATLTAVTGLLFAAWMFSAARNVEQLRVPMRHDAGWAVAAWFVPFLNLVRPKRMMDDIWRASMPSTPPGAGLRQLARPGVVTAWWASWLLAGGLSTAGSAHVALTTLQAQTPVSRWGSSSPVDYARMHETQAVWSLWASAASVVAACCAIVIVRRISDWQHLRAEALHPRASG